MKKEINGRNMVIQVTGYAGTPFAITDGTKLRCEVTHIEDCTIGGRYVVRYYECDIIATEFDDKRPVREFRYMVKMSPSLFTAWHKGVAPSHEVRQLIIDAWYQSHARELHMI